MSDAARETPNLRWFDKFPPCRMCGRKADGLLMDVRNSSYGHHCERCAKRRLADSEKARAALAKASAPVDAAGKQLRGIKRANPLSP